MYIIRSVKVILRYIVNELLDMLRYAKFSALIFAFDNRKKIESRILLLCHTLEKGMALPSPRLNYGRERIDLLLTIVDGYVDKYGFCDFVFLPINILNSYQAINVGRGGQPYDKINDWLERVNSDVNLQGIADTFKGGALKVRKMDVVESVRGVQTDFFNKRYSIRQFSSEEVSEELIGKAAQIAQKSPSVCNRQSGRAYVLTKSEDIGNVLKLQGGARGFSEQVNKLIIFTSELGAFRTVGERNQAFIDGGMYAMSFVYALHSLALATCFLNWSKVHSDDKELRKLVGIPKSEVIIVLTAVGHMLDEFDVALSARIPIKDVVKFI